MARMGYPVCHLEAIGRAALGPAWRSEEAQVLAIRGGTILTPETEIDNGVILIEDGKIYSLGAGLAVPAGCEEIDATGATVIPGLIEPHCHVALFADGIDSRFYDGNEMTDPVTPHVRALDAIHPEDLAFADLRAAGITTVNISPGSGNVIGGQTAIVKTAGCAVDEMVLRAPGAMKMALGENPKRVYGEQKRCPSTRMGNAAVMREWLAKAKTYVAKKARYEEKLIAHQEGKDGAQKPDPFEPDMRLEMLARVVEGNLPAHIHAHRADDIVTAMRIAEEFELDLVLIHATEGYKIAERIAARKIPCIPGPILFSRAKLELIGLSPDNAGRLAKAGVTVAIQTDEASATKYLTLNAAVCAREGLDPGLAFQAITRTAAEILRVDDRVGSLEPGKDADLAILSAHPLDIVNCRVLRTIIDGKTVYCRDV